MDSPARRGSPHNGPASLYSLGSNMSSTSIFEMAHDELFSGPVAESVPTSLSAFAHRRARADSAASFTYYDEARDESIPLEQDRGGNIDDSEFALDEVALSPFEESRSSEEDYVSLRRPSTHSQLFASIRMLRRDSTATAASIREHTRLSQKIYLVNEDLTIAIAGFQNRRLGTALYLFLCIATLGLAYLLFRWLPRWYVRIAGRQCFLSSCRWVVVENHWGEFSILDVENKPYGRSMSTVFGLTQKSASFSQHEDSDPIMEELRGLDYRYVRLCFHPQKDKFVMLSGWMDPAWSSVRAIKVGIDNEEKAVRETVFGPNLIDIKQKTVPQLLVDEVLHPFYVFQVASLLLWFMDQYYLYATCIFLVSVIGITTTLIDTRTTIERLRRISRFECDVRILRNGFWRTDSSSHLVPGDVYEVSDPNLTLFPSDSLLLSGDCIVNESMLTGESVPVSKTPVTNDVLKLLDLASSTVSADTARHFLFCGTKIVRVRRPQEDHEGEAVSLALVVRTGFDTTKGSLVRSMLFPKPSGLKFYRDSFRFLAVMACIAGIGFLASLINFIRLGLTPRLVIVRALDLITIAVPPALPITLTIGTGFALMRLKKRQIFCISPQRVNVGGKLDMMCFDKTGTLTEDGLDVLGIRVVSNELGRFSDILPRASALTLAKESEKATLYTMATCHSLRSIDGELVGDPLDLKMFEFTGWTFQEGNHGTSGSDELNGLSPAIARPPKLQQTSHESVSSAAEITLELGILRSFDFVSHLRRASVIVRQFGQQSGDIYVKGAPECMREICRPESFPSDFDHMLEHYTHNGYRVIGCATRNIMRLSWVKAQKMTRAETERDLEFIGFIIFENKLKPNSSHVIEELLRSNIDVVMITGDNILTAISCARQCHLLNRNTHCFVPHFQEGCARDASACLQWESIENHYLRLDSSTLLPLPLPVQFDASLPHDMFSIRNYSLAVTGEVFRWIVDFAPPRVLQRMLVCGKVFARMSPDEKHELVEKLQSIGYCCGFCGDGANDCGALKVADVGISLSEAEASVAAPFTSRTFDISCVPEIIREGRASLVTSFSCFKYMSIYSAIQFTTVSFLYASASNLGNFQFLFIDIFLSLPIAIFMSWAGPAPVICRKRPTSELVSVKVLTSLLGHMAISIAIQTITFVSVRKQGWYIPPHVKPEKSNVKNSENTALFLVSCFQYIFAGVALNAGPPYRQSVMKNWSFIVTVVASCLLTLYMILGPVRAVKKLMQLTKTSWDFDIFMIGLGLIHWFISLTCEKFVFGRLARVIGFLRVRIMGVYKKRKAYKLIQEEMRW